ncbi:MAG TPA: hypothetical protein VHM02_14370 [Thermoanaerobaculia bacterium]|nr:hypothetical protein [Thermoanaerobaculia bacterium]
MSSLSSLPRKTALALGAAALAVAALPALAGTVVLPHAEHRQVDGEVRQVLLWATNPTAEPRDFTVRFIPTNVDGRTGAQAAKHYRVPAGGTIPVGTAPFGAVGMAEITGYEHLAFTGELNVLTTGNQLIASTEVPLVGSGDLVPARTWAHLLALERDHTMRTSDLGIVNLSRAAGSCTVASMRADGSWIEAPNEIALAPAGHRFFPDAFGALGEPQLDGGRFQITCTVPFWPYAAVTGQVPDFAKLVVPAATGQSALGPLTNPPPAGPPSSNPPPSNPPPTNPPPSNPPPPPSGPVAGELMRRDGTFHATPQGSSYMEITLPIARGQRYRSLTIDFDLATGRFPSNLYIGTVGLMRPVRRGTFFAHTVRADRGKTIIDMGVGDGLVHRGGNDVWRPNTNYHVRVHYNGAGRQIVWELFRGGALVERVAGRVGHPDLVHNGEGIKLFFGLDKAYDNAFFPPWGWRFSNLVVSGQPQ